MSVKPSVVRPLTFKSLSEIVEEARKIAADPKPIPHGNWTVPQNIWHVGRVIEYSANGFPFKAPLGLRIFASLRKNRYLTRAFKPGIKPSQSIESHLVADPRTTMQQALAVIASAFESQQAKGYIPASPIFGKLSATQWEQLHCRHAELHFGLIELAG